jgi:hypothetical protein
MDNGVSVKLFGETNDGVTVWPPADSLSRSRPSRTSLGFGLSKRSVRAKIAMVFLVARTRQDFDYHFGDFALPRLLDVNIVCLTVIWSSEERLDLRY